MKALIQNIQTTEIMNKILLFLTLSVFLISCSGKENDKGIDSIIASKNVEAIKEKRAALQADITKLDEALGGTEKKLEALVAVAKVKDTVFNHYFEVQGNVDTKENITIYPQFSGVLTALNVKTGQKVSKGQVLGRIDDGGLGQQVAQLETQAALAKTTFDRQKRLWDQKIGSEIQYLQAQTNMISQQKAVSQIKAQLAKTVITAPFSGVIDEVMAERGQVVSPGQGLMQIVNLSNMYVSTTIPEMYIGKVKVGTIVDVYLTSLGKTYQGKIRQVANNINAANRSFNIEVSLPNKENLLRPNQVAKLKITDYTRKDAIVVPSNVIQEDAANQKFVYAAVNIKGKTATAKKVLVKVGQMSENNAEIMEGLSGKETIVTEGANNVSEGMKINF